MPVTSGTAIADPTRARELWASRLGAPRGRGRRARRVGEESDGRAISWTPPPQSSPPAVSRVNERYVHDLAIIVISTNEAHWLPACLTTILAQQGDCSLDLIVVDNGSTDGTSELVEERFPLARVVRSENRGFAHGNNEGLVTRTPGMSCFSTLIPRFARAHSLRLSAGSTNDPMSVSPASSS